MPKIISFTNGGMRPLNVKLFRRQASGGGRTLTNAGFKTKRRKSDCCECCAFSFFFCVCVSLVCPQTPLVRRERGGADSGRRIPAEVAFVRGRGGGGCDARETLRLTGAREVASAASLALRLTAAGWLWLSLRRPCISDEDHCREKDDPGDA